MTDDLTIRLATTDDMEEVMRLAIAGVEENAFIDASGESLVREIYPALCLDHGLLPVIGPSGGAIQGMAILRIGTMWYSPEIVLEERAIFIAPEFRSAKGGRASRLCEYTKKVADTLNLSLVIGVLSNTRTAGKVRMYTRIFGEPAGAFFLYNARTTGHKVMV